MSDLFGDLSALPNLHPALVHFPVALVPVAVLMDLSAVLIRSHRDWLDRAATALYALAGVATGLAFWAGRRAADSLAGLTPRQQVAIGEHHDAALLAVWVIGTVTTIRVVIGVWSGPVRKGLTLRALLLPLGVAAFGSVVVAADHGGGLVFEHGVAVAAAQLPAPEIATGSVPQSGPVGLEESAGQPTSRLQNRADGSLTWRPLATDGAAIGSILKPAPGSTLAAVQLVDSGESSGLGLPIEVTGRAVLLLPGEFGDVQVKAELEIVEFSGTVGLVHHVRSAEEYGSLAISTRSGEIRLAAFAHDKEDILDQSQVDLTRKRLHLVAFAAGRHFRGLQDDKVMVHGHRSGLRPGGVGILVAGRGRIRIHGLDVVPISE